MGILITTYKSLPEQVEANKEKCADLQEQINNIDTHEIEEIKQQVEDNTHDITSLTNGLSVTNGLVANHTQRLNGLDTQVGSLETEVAKKVDKVTQYTNSKIEFTTAGNGFDIRRSEGDSDSLTETYVHHVTNALHVGYEYSEDGTMIHSARAILDEDGINFYKSGLDFKVNGNAIVTEANIGTYAPQTHLYQHNLLLKQSGGNQVQFMFQPIYKTNNNAINLVALAQYLYDNNQRDIN
ncbi:MAG: hypothetical protein U0K59_06530, partial [Bacteroidales bacterium]|nr:hypothetical protein [Bacteroidales bacterium]